MWGRCLEVDGCKLKWELEESGEINSPNKAMLILSFLEEETPQQVLDEN